MDDHQLLFELDVMIRAEELRELDKDPRDSYYKAEALKNMKAIYNRFEQLSKADYSRRLHEKLNAPMM